VVIDEKMRKENIKDKKKPQWLWKMQKFTGQLRGGGRLRKPGRLFYFESNGVPI
jgi:hypothetical protein